GRDGQPAQAVTLVSEPTGLLDSEDRQRQQFFLNQSKVQQQTAQRLVRQLPPQGSVQEVARQFKDGAIALALLHSMGQLEWQDPFHYSIQATAQPTASAAKSGTQSMNRYLFTKACRWTFLLKAFGFEAIPFERCGHCDRCRPSKSR
uniref:RecQ family zinc-binding domain-containing protein n=1 Tax=Oculatella sp. LEGE 06141 TaxID=1828648 RepID=UPI00187F2327